MRIVVDRSVCEGHGQCTAFAPAVFTLDEDLVVHYRADPSPELIQQVRAAVDACPTRAIRVDADAGGAAAEPLQRPAR